METPHTIVRRIRAVTVVRDNALDFDAAHLRAWTERAHGSEDAMPSVFGPVLQLDPAREGIDWIEGHHAHDSDEARALLATHLLLRHAT